ncbi:MAG: phage tail sheath subtilisin-like domain-containing protein [Chloroflexi bacterium]|nr:phage tail sheath subtilisin-like domain-containing protein [Chloroflexota bacterium]
MTTYLTPGVYFERSTQTPPLSAQRTHAAGFVGLAERGPLHDPQRLTDWRQFQRVFGGFLTYANLAYSVRAFFENGGTVCWVVRVADVDAAVAASADIPDGDVSTAYHITAVNPGKWGNHLSVSVQAVSLAATQHTHIDGLVDTLLSVDSIAGFQSNSRVRLTQQGGPDEPVIASIVKVDPVLKLLELSEPLTGKGFVQSSDANSIGVESLEFTLLVEEDGQVVERFAGLSPEPEHTLFAPGQVNGVSHFIKMEVGDGDGLPKFPLRGLPLESGVDGLRNLNIFDHIGSASSAPETKSGLAALRAVDEVGLLSMPDLMAQPQEPVAPVRSPVGRVDECALDARLGRSTLEGIVTDAVTGQDLEGVRIEASDGLDIHSDISDGNGSFNLSSLYEGEIELLFTLDGYDNRIIRISSMESLNVTLDPTDQPPVFSEVDIFYAQDEMVRQCRELRDRFAIIDPPRAPGGGTLSVSGLQSWRARFDTPFAALYYPWLIVRDPLNLSAVGGREVPPSGHVAGIFAATDLAEGVWRPPANRVLSFVENVATQVDDVLHGVLNPLGINAIRSFPGRGIRIYGARTMSSDTAWRFVNVRRLMNMLEEAFRDGLRWAVFEPNSTELRLNIKMALTNFLDGLWRKGAFAGGSAGGAYTVRCDITTTPPEVEALGQVIAEVSVAPTVPYEFIILRLGFTADELQVSEV